MVLESSKKPIDVENGDAEDDVFEEPPKYILKHIALKILSLKIFAYLKWDLGNSNEYINTSNHLYFNCREIEGVTVKIPNDLITRFDLLYKQRNDR